MRVPFIACLRPLNRMLTKMLRFFLTLIKFMFIFDIEKRPYLIMDPDQLIKSLLF